MVEFLRDQPELADRLDPGELLVGRIDSLLHQLDDFGLLGQIAIGGVGNALAWSPSRRPCRALSR